MINSILFPDKEYNYSEIDDRSIENLMLTDFFTYICPNKEIVGKFFDLLKRMPTDINTVKYRQDVLHDFVESPALLNKLFEIQICIKELIKEHKKIEKEQLLIKIEKGGSEKEAQYLVQIRAQHLFRVLTCISEMDTVLSNNNYSSSGLILLSDACRCIINNSAYSQLKSLCRKYFCFSLHGFNNCSITLNDSCRITGCYRISYCNNNSKQHKQQNSFINVKEVRDSYFKKLVEVSLTNIANQFAQISKSLLEELARLEDELAFYKVSIEYVEFLKTHRIQFCWPEISNNNLYFVSGVLDLYLLISNNDISHVKRNNLVGYSGRAAIFGKNGSGKTVFLRSIGCSQLLTQSGLPIPAESAMIPICSQMTVLFAKSDSALNSSDSIGRFEQEVRDLSVVMNTSNEGAFVLLNEIFQSTSYDDGEAALIPILNHLSQKGVRWMVVTHLVGLENKLIDTLILHSSSDFVITE